MDTIDWNHLNTIWNVTDIYSYASFLKKKKKLHMLTSK